ncbi:MAG TPA: hypothetical protein V6D18_17385 [Thermosynechococcaceae cyanobacterium]
MKLLKVLFLELRRNYGNLAGYATGSNGLHQASLLGFHLVSIIVFMLAVLRRSALESLR